MGLEVFKEKSKKMNLPTRKDDLNPCFSTDFELLSTILESLERFIFKKSIDYLFHRLIDFL
jgi:hypothetical protein